MLGQPRTTQRRARKVASDEGALRGDIVRLASRFGRYGYRRVTDMLRIEGWGVKHKRVEHPVAANRSLPDALKPISVARLPPEGTVLARWR